MLIFGNIRGCVSNVATIGTQTLRLIKVCTLKKNDNELNLNISTLSVVFTIILRFKYRQK